MRNPSESAARENERLVADWERHRNARDVELPRLRHRRRGRLCVLFAVGNLPPAETTAGSSRSRHASGNVRESEWHASGSVLFRGGADRPRTVPESDVMFSAVADSMGLEANVGHCRADRARRSDGRLRPNLSWL